MFASSKQIKAMLNEFIKAAQTEVDNHSIYVWGGSGQLCCDVSEDWIRTKEKATNLKRLSRSGKKSRVGHIGMSHGASTVQGTFRGA